jgi:site-specific DNA-methyltransferase (adenine-specific)
VQREVHALHQETEARLEAAMTTLPIPRGAPLIIADPPWTYRNASSTGAAALHYQTMTTKDICALPVYPAKDAILLLWATWPMLEDALQVMGAWGFEYKTSFAVWVKVTADGREMLGLGWYTRKATEYVLLGTRGDARRRFIREDRPAISDVLYSTPREHSRKPMAELMEKVWGVFDSSKVFAAGRPLEMFARSRSDPRWDVWGNEVDKFDAEHFPEEEDSAPAAPGAGSAHHA